MIGLPVISSYGDYDSANYGVNTLKVNIGGLTLYYSYKTIVAYCDNTDGFVACVNVWSRTTGKHLNWLQPVHSKRLAKKTFDEMLENVLARHIRQLEKI